MNVVVLKTRCLDSYSNKCLGSVCGWSRLQMESFYCHWMQDVRVERIWEQDYFHVFFDSQKSRRWFNVRSPSVWGLSRFSPFAFLWFFNWNSNKNETQDPKMNGGSERRRKFYANRRQVKRKMLHLGDFVFVLLYFFGASRCNFVMRCSKRLGFWR